MDLPDIQIPAMLMGVIRPHSIAAAIGVYSYFPSILRRKRRKLIHWSSKVSVGSASNRSTRKPRISTDDEQVLVHGQSWTDVDGVETNT